MDKTIQALRLTSEQDAKLNQFIGKCVRNNVSFQVHTNIVGVKPNQDIQSIYALKPDTLKTYGLNLRKMVNNDTSEFEPGQVTTPMAAEGVTAAEMIEIIKLIINEKTYNEAVDKKETQLRAINRQLQALATPEEIKADLLKQKQALLAEG